MGSFGIRDSLVAKEVGFEQEKEGTMAFTEKINKKKWKVLFRDRQTTLSLWPINKYVAEYCDINDGTKRELKIELESKYKISRKGFFTITSGHEVLFPNDFQNEISDAFSDKKSYLTIEVLSNKINK